MAVAATVAATRALSSTTTAPERLRTRTSCVAEFELERATWLVMEDGGAKPGKLGSVSIRRSGFLLEVEDAPMVGLCESALLSSEVPIAGCWCCCCWCCSSADDDV